MEAIKAIGLLLYSSGMQQQLRSLFIEQPPSVRGVTFRLFTCLVLSISVCVSVHDRSYVWSGFD